MFGFWLIIFAMTLLALAFVIIPLVRTNRSTSLTHTQAQLALYQQRLQALQQQLIQGEVDQAGLAQAQLELQKGLVQDASQTPTAALNLGASPRLALVLAISLPLIAGLGYWQWGSSRSLAQWRLAQQQAAQVKAEIAKLGTPEQIAAALRAKLEQNPNSAKGWYLLGNLYVSLQNYPQAVDALAKADQLQPNDVEIMVKFAEALVARQHGLDITSRALVQRILQIAPQNVNALNLLAVGAYQAGDYATAIQRWEQILAQFPAGSEDSKAILNMLAAAQKKLQQQSSSKAVQLHVQVSLAAALKAQLAPSAAVFIYAKALTGPPMPLAVVRKQVQDLPCSVTLDQSQAMLAGMSLQDAKKVRVYARISESGQAMPQANDWQAVSEIIDMQHPPAIVQLTINQRPTKQP